MSDNELTALLLLAALTATLAGLFVARRRALALRPIPAYLVLPEAAADAVESDNRLHLALGGAGLGQTGTVSALAAAEIFYRLAERLAISYRPPLLTVSDPLALPLAQDTLRRAYEFRHKMALYRSSHAVWYPQGLRSLAFAAGAASLAADAGAYGNVLLGRFGSELALLGESALRYDQAMIAHSDLLEGQAVAFVQADQVLLGEELYVGAAYLGRRPVDLGSVLVLDLLRWGAVLGVLLAALEAAL